ncbi:hypothetical protein MtrunA17_Chr7g0274871 [Medicago truncatula]|uniref:Transmembrane protein n=1 Tax=Medicago truncatula TaxID=3880 RepID=A0A396H873_MEDTR|nr:hypothetical protein MtrunA17_Chr7g0274871 [Medicago truncatula]
MFLCIYYCAYSTCLFEKFVVVNLAYYDRKMSIYIILVVDLSIAMFLIIVKPLRPKHYNCWCYLLCSLFFIVLASLQHLFFFLVVLCGQTPEEFNLHSCNIFCGLSNGFNVNNTNSYGNAWLDPQLAAEKAVSEIGQGYNLCNDIRFSACKPRLIHIDNSSSNTRDLVFPSGVVVPNVPLSIKSDKGDCTRFRSDVLTFNQTIIFVALSGKIPSGQFNSMFDMKKCWSRDAASTKSLAFDGWFITLYTVELDRTNTTLSETEKRRALFVEPRCSCRVH